MFETLSIASTGLQAQQRQVETIANNLANMNSTAFKKSRVRFSSLYGGQVNSAADPTTVRTTGQPMGVTVSAVERIFTAGNVRRTDAPLDLAVDGNGFVEVVLEDGTTALSRGGSLRVRQDGQLAIESGAPLKAGITVNGDVSGLLITQDGAVGYRSSSTGSIEDLGRMYLVKVANPAGLREIGPGMYLPTAESGAPVAMLSGEPNSGRLMQGYVETANVELVDEFVGLTVTQRAYEANAKVIQVADEMLSIINNLRR